MAKWPTLNVTERQKRGEKTEQPAAADGRRTEGTQSRHGQYSEGHIEYAPPVANEETFDLIGPGHSYETVTEKISSIVLNTPITVKWLLAIMFTGSLLGLLGISILWLVLKGTGIWGNNQPVGWAFDIINFVWWIGIGHAGTLISAILLLLHQNWRTSI